MSKRKFSTSKLQIYAALLVEAHHEGLLEDKLLYLDLVLALCAPFRYSQFSATMIKETRLMKDFCGYLEACKKNPDAFCPETFEVYQSQLLERLALIQETDMKTDFKDEREGGKKSGRARRKRATERDELIRQYYLKRKEILVSEYGSKSQIANHLHEFWEELYSDTDFFDQSPSVRTIREALKNI